MAAALARHLAVAFDLPPLAFIAGRSQSPSACPREGDATRGGLGSAEWCNIPRDGDVSIPLCARVSSAARFRLSLRAVAVGRSGLSVGGRLRRSPVGIERLFSHVLGPWGAKKMHCSGENGGLLGSSGPGGDEASAERDCGVSSPDPAAASACQRLLGQRPPPLGSGALII